MSYEELELIIKALEGLGATAGNGFYIWIAYKAFVASGQYVFCCLVLLCAYKIAEKLINQNRTEEKIRDIRSSLIGSYGEVSEYDIDKMSAEIRRLKKQKNEGDDYET